METLLFTNVHVRHSRVFVKPSLEVTQIRGRTQWILERLGGVFCLAVRLRWADAAIFEGGAQIFGGWGGSVCGLGVLGELPEMCTGAGLVQGWWWGLRG